MKITSSKSPCQSFRVFFVVSMAGRWSEDGSSTESQLETTFANIYSSF